MSNYPGKAVRFIFLMTVQKSYEALIFQGLFFLSCARTSLAAIPAFSHRISTAPAVDGAGSSKGGFALAAGPIRV